MAMQPINHLQLLHRFGELHRRGVPARGISGRACACRWWTGMGGSRVTHFCQSPVFSTAQTPSTGASSESRCSSISPPARRARPRALRTCPPPAPKSTLSKRSQWPCSMKPTQRPPSLHGAFLVPFCCAELAATSGSPLASLAMHAEGGDVEQIPAAAAGLGKRRRGHALAPIAGEGLVLVDDLRDGRGGGGAIVALRVFAIDLFRGGVFAGVRPGHLRDVGHLGINGVGQPPGEAIEALHVRRAGLPGLDGLREIQVVGVVIFRAAAIPLQPRAAPVFAGAINRPVLAAGGVFGNRRADHIRRQAGHIFGVDAPAGHGHADLRRALP